MFRPADLKTKPLFRSFPTDSVISLVSDGTLDFAYPKDSQGLSKDQQKFLEERIGERPRRFINIKQVHEDCVLAVDESYNNREEADALITDRKGVALMVRTADCLPVFLFDAKHRTIGLVHAGWRSTEKEIVVKTVRLMKQRFGSQPEDILAAFGPAIRQESYEVGEDVARKFPEAVTQKAGRLCLDLPGANKKQLLSQGIKACNIEDCRIDTFTDENYFSYRRQGSSAGRMISLLMMRE